MAASSRGLHVSRKWQGSTDGSSGDRDVSPERTVVWTERKACSSRPSRGRSSVAARKMVPVVYYISRNGHLEHPHFIEVSLARSANGLHLKEVLNRLSQLRGRGMTSLYSWSAKRSYRNGFVWHDLSEDDLVPPSSPQQEEYVLKGTLLYPPDSLSSKLSVSHEAAVSSSFRYADDPSPIALSTRRRNQSCSSIDLVGLSEYKVRKGIESGPLESTRETVAADAATQTEEGRARRRQQTVVKGEREVEEVKRGEGEGVYSLERRGDEIEEVTPPPSDSSPETLESLLKADGPLVLTAVRDNEGNDDDTADEGCGRTTKASAMLMQLISCGSLSFRDCGAGSVKEHGLTMIGGRSGRISRLGGATPKDSGSFPRVSLEEKEYFSGTLVEIKKRRDGDGDSIGRGLKRSNSFNADR